MQKINGTTNLDTVERKRENYSLKEGKKEENNVKNIKAKLATYRNIGC